jgi:hypothetical protein
LTKKEKEMELSLIIYLSGIATFILLAIIGDKKDIDAVLIPSIILGFIWAFFGIFYTIEATQEKKYVEIIPTVTKTDKKVIVEWENFEDYDRTTYFTEHEDYMAIDSNVVWKSIIRKNSWGYHWSDNDDIEYFTKKNE